MTVSDQSSGQLTRLLKTISSSFRREEGNVPTVYRMGRLKSSLLQAAMEKWQEVDAY